MEDTVKVIQQQVFHILRELETKSERIAFLQSKYNRLDDHLTEILIELSSLKADMLDLNHKLHSIFNEQV